MSEKKRDRFAADPIAEGIDQINRRIGARNKAQPNLRLPRVVTGLEAEKLIGIQHEFFGQLALMTHYNKNFMILRASNTPPSFDSRRDTKPQYIKSKTCNHGLARTLIPEDPDLQRIDDTRNPLAFAPKDQKRIKEHAQDFVQLQLTLREILDLTRDPPLGDLTIAQDQKDKNAFILRYREGFGPKDFTGHFIVKLHDPQDSKDSKELKEAKTPGETSQKIYTRPWNVPTEESDNKLIELLRKQFNINVTKDQLNGNYDIYYQNNAAQIKPFRVFAGEHGKPVTGDWDIFMISQASSNASAFPTPNFAFQAHNTLSPDSRETENLLKKFKDLFIYYQKETLEKFNALLPKEKQTKEIKEIIGALSKSNPDPKILDAYKRLDPIERLILTTRDAMNLCDETAIVNAGNITPVEFFQAMLLNKSYGSETSVLGADKKGRLISFGEKNFYFDPNIKKVFEHGPENRNPGQISDMNGRLAIILNGMCIVTEGEDVLIELLMVNDILKNNTIDIHPFWSMEKWGPVVEKLAEHGHIDLTGKNLEQRKEQNRVAQIYNDYKQMMKLSKELENKSPSLTESQAKLIQRCIEAHQPIPKNVSDAREIYEKQQKGQKTTPSILTFTKQPSEQKLDEMKEEKKDLDHPSKPTRH